MLAITPMEAEVSPPYTFASVGLLRFRRCAIIPYYRSGIYPRNLAP